ncbi:MAG: hypothetical protein MUF10_02185 [Thermoanaerobaculaceae bacterium]|nr:hypothetical protein [Thermoanaerobaculaceae bacterium]
MAGEQGTDHDGSGGQRPAGRDTFRWDDRHHQPHTDLSYLQKLWASRSDLTRFLSLVGCNARHLVPVLASYRRLLRHPPPPAPVTPQAFGVAVSPRPETWGRSREHLDRLGVRALLLRAPVWDPDPVLRLRPELEALAREGWAITVVLVQDRAAVCDPRRWRDFVSTVAAELGEAVHAFQIGQAPNRKKWGVWRPDEYVRLLEGVQEARAASPHRLWLGPSVIDFEYHFVVNSLFRFRPFDFDGIASLLYVDRRGSPESTQYGHFDLGRKILLLRAVIETSRHPVVPIHLTEFNWPLRDTGRFSPAGRHVQVDEDDQAAYLVLYYLASAASGCVASAFWWQLVAHGYGLVDDEGDAWRTRPAFAALQELLVRTRGRTVLRLPAASRRVRGYLLGGGEGDVVVYAADGPVRVGGRLPMSGAWDLGGCELDPSRLVLGSRPCYLRLATAGPAETLAALAAID